MSQDQGIEQYRSGFEAWAEPFGYDIRWDGTDYFDDDTRYAFQGYCAAKREASTEPSDAQAAADAFALAWGAALDSAAFYVAGHCANGDFHAETILEMPAPTLTFRDELTPGSARGRSICCDSKNSSHPAGAQEDAPKFVANAQWLVWPASNVIDGSVEAAIAHNKAQEGK